MAGFGVYSYVSERQRLEIELDESAQHIHQRLISNLKLPLYQYDRAQAETVLRIEMMSENVVSISVFDDRHQLYVGMEKDPAGSVNAFGAGRSSQNGCYKKLSGPIEVDGMRKVGDLDLCVSDMTLRSALRSLVVSMLLQTAAVSLVLCLCVFASLDYVLLKPVMVIRAALARFAAKDFSSRSALSSADELGELSQHFNSMASTIQDYSENLESTIEERTLELLRKNEIIQREKEEIEQARQAQSRLLQEQQELIKKLKEAQGQLLQSEKMASIGQLAAGVAHEINNPIGFINSNLGTLKSQVDGLLTVLACYQKAESALVSQPELLEEIERTKSAADFAFLQGDIVDLINESRDGVGRVKKIVDNLKDFSRVDTAEWAYANLESGLESTLNIVWNEIKYKADIRRNYAGLPEVFCIASQLNQVFMNLLVNAAHAIEQSGVITLNTGFDEATVWVEVEDTGKGIKPEHMNRIFEPFFTTKPIGKGTGLGLSLSYGIVERHHGRFEVRSELGEGTVFRITLPREQSKDDVLDCASSKE